MYEKDYTEPFLDLYRRPSDTFADTVMLLVFLCVSFVWIGLINNFNEILETIHGAG